MQVEETKTCSKCSEAKSLGEYYLIHRRGRDEYRPMCKACERLATSKYQKANRDKMRIKNKTYRQLNGAKVRLWEKKYRDANRYAVRSKNRKHHELSRIELRDDYIKDLLCKHSILVNADIPAELISLHREQLKIARILRKLSA